MYATSLDIRKAKNYINLINGMQLKVDKYQSKLDRLIIIKQVDPITSINSLCNAFSNMKFYPLKGQCKYLISIQINQNIEKIRKFNLYAILLPYIIIGITYIYCLMTSIPIYMDLPELRIMPP